MTTPSKRKAIHDLLSPKIAERRKRKKAAEAARVKNPPIPPTVNNYHKNKPFMARSLNVQPTTPVKLKINPTIGMPAVNGKSGEEVVKKAVHKVRPKKPIVDPRDAALNVTPGGKSGPKSKTKRTSSKRTSKS